MFLNILFSIGIAVIFIFLMQVLIIATIALYYPELNKKNYKRTSD